jgi:hypothetical protein
MRRRPVHITMGGAWRLGDSRELSGCYCARMQAAVHTRYGPPEMVRIAEVEKPTIADNEVLF